MENIEKNGLVTVKVDLVPAIPAKRRKRVNTEVRFRDTAQYKANRKYYDKNYAQVKLSVPKSEADTLTAYCKEVNVSKAGFIRQAIKEKMERDMASKVNLPVIIPTVEAVTDVSKGRLYRRKKRRSKLMNVQKHGRRTFGFKEVTVK